ncbi:MAG: hypothetical protein P4L31_08075, partial [Candidatus Babeliales bacterium]|nr:hypothetical protein [Candidatus Babeliales bacterium]
MKKIHYYIFCSLMLLSIPATYCDDFFDDFSTEGMDSFSDDSEIDLMPALSQDQMLKSLSPAEIVPLLNDLSIIDLLKHNIYCRTNRINSRSLLDYSVFLDPKMKYDYRWVTNAHVFYNQTSRVNFTSDSTNISSYLGICNPDLLADINTAFKQVVNLGLCGTDLDPLAVIPLFKFFTAQERRAGAMLHAARDFNSCRLSMWIPLYYLERNLFATEVEREAIEASLGALTVDEQQHFQKKHLISDKFGFGDSRLEVDFNVSKTDDSLTQIGLQLTVPTAFAIASGLEGSTFHRCCERPLFDFELLINRACGDSDQAKAESLAYITDFMTGALDQLAANLLDNPLGNGGHFGLGADFLSTCALSHFVNRPWAQKINLFTKLSVEYLLPCRENRYFINQVNIDEFNSRDFSSTDPAIAASNLAFLNIQMVDRLYPYVLPTLVFPGVVVHWIGKSCYEAKNWGGALGVDL